MNPGVDLFFKFVFVDEAVDLQGAEKVAMPADAARGYFPGAPWPVELRINCQQPNLDESLQVHSPFLMRL